MSGRVVFATHNAGKRRELEGLLAGRLAVLGPEALEGFSPPAEDGATFAENAALKARACAGWAGLPALADDSGLCVDALGGRPGVHSARYAEGSDADRVAALLAELEGVPEERRGARFRCALALALPSGEVFLEEGEVLGRILPAPRGSLGFGYDPVFWLPDPGRAFAELSREEKAGLSHRGRAFRKMVPRLLALP